MSVDLETLKLEAELAAAREENERLRKALEKYGDHEASCPAMWAEGACRCGWTEFRDGLAPTPAEPTNAGVATPNEDAWEPTFEPPAAMCPRCRWPLPVAPTPAEESDRG